VQRGIDREVIATVLEETELNEYDSALEFARKRAPPTSTHRPASTASPGTSPAAATAGT